jgi:two-component system response regulator YesN
MILEDEPLARIGMKTIIPWEEHGYHIVGEASDGREAIEVATACKPDIILVDIVLPEMNGLDFISTIKSVLRSTKFIILSNWEDLKYYRKAIRLGVSEYIVKSAVQPQEILEIVDRVSREIRKQRVFEDSEKEVFCYESDMVILSEFLNKILEGEITDETLIQEKIALYNLDFNDSYLYVLVMELHSNDDNGSSEDEMKSGTLLSVCNEIIRDVASGVLFRSYEGMFTALVGLAKDKHYRENLDYLTHRLHETVFQIFDYPLSIGVSERLSSFCDIVAGYSQGEAALERVFFEGPGKTFYYRKESEENTKTRDGAIEECFHTIVSTASLLEIPDILEQISSLENMLRSDPSVTRHEAREIFADILYHFKELSRSVSVEDELTEMLASPFDIVESSQTLEELTGKTRLVLNQIKRCLDTRYAGTAQRLVNKVNQFIGEHFSEKITLEAIAGYIHFSPSYISRVYKQETGITVHERVVQVKIEKSKELLLQKHTLASIAEELNFSSESYFIKVFKEHTGQTPGHFLKYAYRS